MLALAPKRYDSNYQDILQSQYNIADRDVPTCTQIRMCEQLDAASIGVLATVKSIICDYSTWSKTVLMTNDSLMKVESIAECSYWSIPSYILVAFPKQASYMIHWLSVFTLAVNNWSWNIFKPVLVFFEWTLKTGFFSIFNLYLIVSI